MCGILGSINFSFSEKELSLIKHRGPDSYGINCFDFQQSTVQLAMTRLSIQDLSESGNQPMFSNCGNYAIIFNGEIYNHWELRENLKEFTFQGHSDTETVLYFLIKYGIDKIIDFNGIFAFCFLDIRNERMYIARDQIGVKPLYYYHNAGKFIFASEIRPISKMVNIVPDVDNIATLLKLRYVPSPETVYNDIKKLRPGHYIEITDFNKVELNIYPYIIPNIADKQINHSEALIKLGDKLSKAVKRQLLSDVEVGILLSGGIDSSIVAALAHKFTDYKMKAFTIGFDGSYEEDEINSAKEVADLYGYEHICEKISFVDFLSMLEEVSRIVEEPIATSSTIPMFFLSRLASKYVKVVLSGQGIDELLGGYRRYQGEIIGDIVPRKLFSFIGLLVPIFNLKNERVIRAASSLGEKNDIIRFAKIYSVFSDSEISKMLKVVEHKSVENIKYFYELLDCKQMKTPVERMMAVDTRMDLADDLLMYTDKITMNFSLECRVPLLDTELVEYIETIPGSYRVKCNKSKVLYKEYARALLPQNIINRKKRGFESPTKVWFRKYSDEIKSILLKSNSTFSSIFNLDEVDNVIALHQKGFNKEKQIFLLLSLFYWLSQL